MTNEPIKNLLPNTTQVPNVILDEWMPRLSDVEFRLLLVVVRQTLGWIADAETKTRKTEDWISGSQLAAKSGRSRSHISRSMKKLIEDHQLVVAVDSKGRALDTSEKRRAKFGKIFYRLNVHAPAPSLFDEIDKKALKTKNLARVRKTHTEGDSVRKGRTLKGHTTKETHEQKESIHTMQPDKPVASRKLKEKKKGNPDHRTFLAFWDSMVLRTRGVKPIYTGADMRNLKRILDFGVPEQDLEQIALYFLADYGFKSFSPSISTLCSAGIINGLLNRSKNGNDPEFWRNMNRYMDQYLRAPIEKAPERKVYDPEDASTFSTMSSLADSMKKLLDRYNQNTIEKIPTPAL